MATDCDGFRDFVLDQLADLDGVRCRAMFGGYGLYRQDRCFGILLKSRLYFKTSAQTRPAYQAHGMAPFRPNSTQTLSSFYEVPVDILEQADSLAAWATAALSVTTRSEPRSTGRRRTNRIERIPSRKRRPPTEAPRTLKRSGTRRRSACH